MSQLKTYVLLDHLQPTAPIYQRVSKNQRQRINKLPVWQPYLVYTFADKDGMNKTIRLKLNSNTIDQAEQIKNGILANQRFTTSERTMRTFRNGSLTTNNKILQDFLEATPHFDGFSGSHPTIKRAAYKLLDREKEIESTNQAFLDNLAAANKIAKLSLEQGTDLLISIHGTHYKVPKTLKEVQNALVDHMNSSDEAVQEILKENFSFDEEVTIIINKLMNADLLSFTAIDGAVAKNKNGSWVSLKEVGKQFSFEEKKERFTEFLSTKDGFTLLADLKKMAEDISGAKEVKKKEPEKTE